MEIRMLAAKLRVQITVLVQSLTAQKKRLSVLQLYELCRFGYIKLIFSSAGRRKRRKIEIRMWATKLRFQLTVWVQSFTARNKRLCSSAFWAVSVWLLKVNFLLNLSTEAEKNRNTCVSSQASRPSNSFGSEGHSGKPNAVRFWACGAVSKTLSTQS